MTEPVDTAVILAAGAGERLGDAAAGRPKGLLRIGDETIVSESIAKLRGQGLSRIIVVTGYGAAHYEQLRHQIGGDIELVYNERFDSTGSMRSFCRAAERSRGPFLLLESDLIYEVRALDEIAEAAGRDIVLASSPTDAGDEVWIEADNQRRLVAMSKDRARLGSNIIGELVGICKISSALCRRMLEAGARRGADTMPVDYEDCLTDAAAAHPVPCVTLDDLAWAEIDTPEHLARARRTVYPEIAAREARY